MIQLHRYNQETYMVVSVDQTFINAHQSFEVHTPNLPPEKNQNKIKTKIDINWTIHERIL